MFNQNPYSTFQGGYFPPANFQVPPPQRPITDQEYVKTFESQIRQTLKVKSTNLLKYNNETPIHSLVKELRKLTEQTATMENNVDTMLEPEWMKKVESINGLQTLINSKIKDVQENFLIQEKKRLNRIKARKLRRKRVSLAKKQEREERLKQWEEKSRKIDENLQKIKDEDCKVKQEQESKIRADIVLKEVLRKKSDAKKCIAKLDALIKLRRARQNTARGRGDDVSEKDAESFNSNIVKLKSLWTEKLSIYEKEESELRSTLQKDNIESSVEKAERKTVENLEEWKKWLFGDEEPQRDFQRDVGEFVRVRSQWDHFISSDGTALPVGWVVPSDKTPDIIS